MTALKVKNESASFQHSLLIELAFGGVSFMTVSQWKDAKCQSALPSMFYNDHDVKTYYHCFWGLHPRHALDLFHGHDGRPTLASVTLEDNLKRSFQPLVPNVKMTIQILELGDMDKV